MSGQRKARNVYQERIAHRQAVERLRRVYAKLCTQKSLETNRSVPNPSVQTVQEEQK
jgi:hypothetical protein